jgi:hypothetical protein
MLFFFSFHVYRLAHSVLSRLIVTLLPELYQIFPPHTRPMVAVLVHPPECSPHMLLCVYFSFFFYPLDSTTLFGCGHCYSINPVYFNLTTFRFTGPVRVLTCTWMARRRKNRTHLKGVQSSVPSSDDSPKSFVIKHGHVGPSLTQLTRDVRKVMEPNTATRLKVDLSSSPL